MEQINVLTLILRINICSGMFQSSEKYVDLELSSYLEINCFIASFRLLSFEVKLIIIFSTVCQSNILYHNLFKQIEYSINHHVDKEDYFC